MLKLAHLLVYLKRITHCRGFGIQSPTDYWLVRYVINEHWPYYQYLSLGEGDDWLTRKLGRLYFRILNLEGDYRQRLSYIYNKVNEQTVLIVDGIRKDMGFWKELKSDERARVTFDLYYCGIVFFDKKRHKQNYIINF